MGGGTGVSFGHSCLCDAKASPGPSLPRVGSSSSESKHCSPSGRRASWEKGEKPFSKQACGVDKTPTSRVRDITKARQHTCSFGDGMTVCVPLTPGDVCVDPRPTSS